MARRRQHEEHVDHERWAIPYADLLTLLLAFFVVMYAVSSINEGKYRIASDSLITAFRTQPKSMDPVQVGDRAQSRPDALPQPETTIAPLSLGSHFIVPPDEADVETPYEGAQHLSSEDLAAMEAAAQAMALLADDLANDMAPLIDADLVRIRRSPLWIEVEIKTSLLFGSGSAQLSREAVPVLEQVAWTLRGQSNRIHVEGFTDNVPINTPIYPSNWELSAARAASVVHLFTRSGLDPTRMAAIGYGEYRPAGPNDTEAGRQQNRRVAIVIFADGRFGGGRESQSPEMLREEMLRSGQAPGAGNGR